MRRIALGGFGWFHNRQLLPPVLFSPPQQNAPSGPCKSCTNKKERASRPAQLFACKAPYAAGLQEHRHIGIINSEPGGAHVLAEVLGRRDGEHAGIAE